MPKAESADRPSADRRVANRSNGSRSNGRHSSSSSEPTGLENEEGTVDPTSPVCGLSVKLTTLVLLEIQTPEASRWPDRSDVASLPCERVNASHAM